MFRAFDREVGHFALDHPRVAAGAPVDRLIERFTTALEERERRHAEREIVRMLSAELPLLPMWIAIAPTFVPTGFSGWLGYKKGLLPDGSNGVTPDRLRRRS